MNELINVTLNDRAMSLLFQEDNYMRLWELKQNIENGLEEWRSMVLKKIRISQG